MENQPKKKKRYGTRHINPVMVPMPMINHKCFIPNDGDASWKIATRPVKNDMVYMNT